MFSPVSARRARRSPWVRDWGLRPTVDAAGGCVHHTHPEERLFANSVNQDKALYQLYIIKLEFNFLSMLIKIALLNFKTIGQCIPKLFKIRYFPMQKSHRVWRQKRRETSFLTSNSMGLLYGKTDFFYNYRICEWIFLKFDILEGKNFRNIHAIFGVNRSKKSVKNGQKVTSWDERNAQ